MRRYFHGGEDKHVVAGSPFEVGGVQYPANWFDCATADEIAEAGFALVVQSGEPGDERYFVVTEVLNGSQLTVTNTPRPLDVVRAVVLGKIKDLRQTTLDGFTKSAGVSAVYAENLLAAQRFTAADATPLRGGDTPTQYLTAMATKMGMTAAAFASYILAENQLAARKAAAVERVYLDYAYTRLQAATFEAALLMFADYEAAIVEALLTT